MKICNVVLTAALYLPIALTCISDSSAKALAADNKQQTAPVDPAAASALSATKAIADLYKTDAEHSARMAEETIKKVEEHATFLARLWAVAAVVGGLILFGLAFFGIKGIQDVWALRKSMYEDQMRIREELRALQEDQGEFLANAEGNHEAMMQCYLASRIIDEAPRRASAEAKVQLMETARRLRKVITETQPSHTAILAWTYNLYAFIESTLGKNKTALEAVQKSLELAEDSADANYNAACYAALLGLREEALAYLERAIELAPGYKIDAQADEDLTSLRADPDFQRVVSA